MGNPRERKTYLYPHTPYPVTQVPRVRRSAKPINVVESAEPINAVRSVDPIEAVESA
jgi:hypothetical protein